MSASAEHEPESIDAALAREVERYHAALRSARRAPFLYMAPLGVPAVFGTGLLLNNLLFLGELESPIVLAVFVLAMVLSALMALLRHDHKHGERYEVARRLRAAQAQVAEQRYGVKLEGAFMNSIAGPDEDVPARVDGAHTRFVQFVREPDTEEYRLLIEGEEPPRKTA